MPGETLNHEDTRVSLGNVVHLGVYIRCVAHSASNGLKNDHIENESTIWQDPTIATETCCHFQFAKIHNIQAHFFKNSVSEPVVVSALFSLRWIIDGSSDATTCALWTVAVSVINRLPIETVQTGRKETGGRKNMGPHRERVPSNPPKYLCYLRVDV